MRFAISSDAHSSIGKALHVLDVETLLVETDDHRFTLDALEAALASDPHPENVIGVVATAGTTNAGIVDDLEGLGSYAREHDLWFHVDGAYGGAAIFSADPPSPLAGLRHADSFIVDPHKWLFAPLDCCALIYRNPTVARKVLAQQASYLDVLHDSADENYEWNPSDFGIHLSRRARGLPFWFSLVTNGPAAYESAVQVAIDLAQRTQELIDESDHLEMVRPSSLSIVLFRRLGWDAEHYNEWSQDLLRSPDRLRHAHQVGGRDRRTHRVPAPQHDRRDGASRSWSRCATRPRWSHRVVASHAARYTNAASRRPARPSRCPRRRPVGTARSRRR